jgi:hypothetical protein
LLAFETSGGMRGTSTEWRGGQCGDDSVADGVFGLVDRGDYVMQFGLSCAMTRPAYLQARERTRLKHGVTEQAAVTPQRPPVSAADARSAAALAGAPAAPLAGNATAQATRQASAMPSAPPVAALDPRVSAAATSGRAAQVEPRAAPAAPAAPAAGSERALAPQVPANATRVQPKLTQPPEIIAPVENSSVQADTLRVQVRAASAEGAAEVELTWIKGAPARWRSPAPAQWPTVAPIVWRVAMSELVRGAVVPVSARPQLDGYYTVKVRVSSGSVSSDWSAPRWIYVKAEGGDALATESQARSPRLSPATPPPSRALDWKQAPSTFGR